MDQSQKLQELLKMLALNGNDLSKLTTQQQKKFEEYKFWKTQPVAKFDEDITSEGPIEHKTVDEIPAEPLPLLGDFEWVTMDLNSDSELEDVYELLNENYVEDKDSTFRFNYSKKFVSWALKPPGWKPEWHVGVRVKKTGKLVAFISAVPMDLKVRTRDVKSVEINLLCIHKQLRAKRLAPILIKEITRRVNRHDIWQALYSAGIVLPSPITKSRYTHRPLDWNKLYEVGFSSLPQGVTKTQMIAKYTLTRDLKTEGFRKMTEADLEQTFELFNKYQERFDLIQNFTLEEFQHWILGEDEVVYAYVAEKDNKITDFISFYSLPFTILENPLHKDLGIGYLFYYASDADFEDGRFSAKGTQALKKRLGSLVYDTMNKAKELNLSVFNALTSQDNCLFLEDLKFGPGDGFLNFYLFNYKAKPITGGLTEDERYDVKERSNLGVVML